MFSLSILQTIPRPRDTISHIGNGLDRKLREGTKEWNVAHFLAVGSKETPITKDLKWGFGGMAICVLLKSTQISVYNLNSIYMIYYHNYNNKQSIMEIRVYDILP